MNPPPQTTPSLGKRLLMLLPFAAIALIFFVPSLTHHSKAVTAAAYAAYVAILAVVAAVLFRKQKRRGMTIGAAVTAAVFLGLGLFYAYLAYVEPR